MRHLLFPAAVKPLPSSTDHRNALPAEARFACSGLVLPLRLIPGTCQVVDVQARLKSRDYACWLVDQVLALMIASYQIVT
jgi:hypothetical protein